MSEEGHLPYMRPPLSKEMWYDPDSAKKDELTFKQWNGSEKRYTMNVSKVHYHFLVYFSFYRKPFKNMLFFLFFFFVLLSMKICVNCFSPVCSMNQRTSISQQPL